MCRSLDFRVHGSSWKAGADYFHFDERQSSDYLEAAKVLGLVAQEKGCYRLTDTGKHLVGLPVEERNLFVLDQVSDSDLVRHCLDTMRSTGRLTRKHIEELIAKESHLAGSTVPGRAGSLAAWLRWIGKATGSIVEAKGAFRVMSGSCRGSEIVFGENSWIKGIKPAGTHRVRWSEKPP
jgi:hypothetical protein